MESYVFILPPFCCMQCKIQSHAFNLIDNKCRPFPAFLGSFYVCPWSYLSFLSLFLSPSSQACKSLQGKPEIVVLVRVVLLQRQLASSLFLTFHFNAFMIKTSMHKRGFVGFKKYFNFDRWEMIVGYYYYYYYFR